MRFLLGDEQLRLVNEKAEYVILRGEWTIEVEEASAKFSIYSVCNKTKTKSFVWHPQIALNTRNRREVLQLRLHIVPKH